MERNDDLRANVEYLQGGCTKYFLDNNIDVLYYNNDTDLIFYDGIREIGRYNLPRSRYTAYELIQQASAVTREDLLQYFNNK